jgi:hypothetical protein
VPNREVIHQSAPRAYRLKVRTAAPQFQHQAGQSALATRIFAPYRLHRQWRNTVMERAPRGFVDQVLDPSSVGLIAPCGRIFMK